MAAAHRWAIATIKRSVGLKAVDSLPPMMEIALSNRLADRQPAQDCQSFGPASR